MEKITSKEQFEAAALSAAFLTDDNFWIAREAARVQSNQYTPIKLEGDDPLRFLHVSVDDLNKVAYTKDAESGRADIQTRTTMTAYCTKFGLTGPRQNDLPTSPLAGLSHGRTTGVGV